MGSCIKETLWFKKIRGRNVFLQKVTQYMVIWRVETESEREAINYFHSF